MLDFFKKLPKLFYLGEFYVDLAKKGAGIGLGYIFIQIILACLPQVIAIYKFAPEIAQIAVDVGEKLPELTFSKHKLGMNQPSPYIIDVEIDGKKKGSVVFDLDIEEKDPQKLGAIMKQRDIYVLITKDYAATRSSREIPVAGISNFADVKNLESYTINTADWKKVYGFLASNGAVILMYLFITIMTVGIFFMALIKGLMIKALSLFFQAAPGFVSSIRLAAASSVPPIALDFALGIAGYPVHPVGSFILWLAIAIYALVCIGADDRKNETIGV